MTQATNSLDNLHVASPCPVAWDSMSGDDRVRFCPQCARNVYHLSGMPRREAEALVAATEGQLCVRFYRRDDGTMMTQDCPVGLQALRKRLLWVVSAAAALLLAILGLGAAALSGGRGEEQAGTRLRDLQPFRTLFGLIDPAPAPPPMLMGEVCPVPRGRPLPPAAPPDVLKRN